jgi:histidinol-phosphate aminotransferase
MKPRPRDSLLSLEPYPVASRAAPGRRYIRLDQNESASLPSQAALEAARSALSDANRYPDADAWPLREAICELEDLPDDRVVCGAGSMELLGLIAQAYLRPGEEALASEYGYLYFRTVAQVGGGSVVLAPERDFRADVDALLDRVGPRTRMVFLANPNNPTGTFVARSEIERLRDALREDIILILDGAYAEYVRDTSYEPGIAIASAAPNVVMLRSFSKIHGLAGLRIGWGYFPAEMASTINRIRHPNAITRPGIAAATAAIRDRAHVKSQRSANASQREWLFRALQSLGFQPRQGHGNFLLLPFERSAKAAAAYAYLRHEGILVRPMSAYRLDHCLRVTIGTQEELKALIAALGEWTVSQSAVQYDA